MQILINLTALSFVMIYMSYGHALEVSEKLLVDLANGKSLKATSIEASYLGAKLELESFKDGFQPSFFSNAHHSDSSEKSIAVFIPKFGPTDELSLGVKQATTFGTIYSVSAYTHQQTTVDGSIDKATTTGVSLALDFDLWKDFLGRSTRQTLNSKLLNEKKSSIESTLQLKSNEVEVRKIYWSIVANMESQKIIKKLLKSAEDQLAVAKLKKLDSVFDEGDISRYKVQITTREGTLLALNYQREQLLRALKAQIPELNSKEIKIGSYDLEASTQLVLQCTKLIKSYSSTPWENTPIDDLLNLVDEKNISEEKINDLYSDIDLKLSAEFHVTGVDNGYSESYDDFSESGRDGYSVGLSLSIPLGSQKHRTKQVLQKVQSKKFVLEKQQYIQQVASEHEQISKLILLLENSARTQKENSKNLQDSLNDMSKKYKQARIDLTRLVGDQDALMQSLLQETATQLNVIHTILDYFKIFPETPCSVNSLRNKI